MTVLDLSSAPSDPIERLKWLSEAEKRAKEEFQQAYRETYFLARVQGRFEFAVALGLHGTKKALQFTRQANNQRQRMVRWNDKLDRTSSAYWR